MFDKTTDLSNVNTKQIAFCLCYMEQMKLPTILLHVVLTSQL